MSTRPHALLLPFPASGHVSPLLQLAQNLVASHGFLVTFVNTEHNHTSFLQAKAKQSQSGALKMVGLPDGLPPDLYQLAQSMPHHMKPLLEKLMCEINQSSTPITCVIADIFMPWAHAAAKTARVPVVLGFYVSSIDGFSLLFHIPFLISSGQLNPDDGTPNEAVEKVTGIPGLSDIAVANFPWVGRPGREHWDKAMFEFLASVQAHVEQWDAILFNSYNELEAEVLKALEEETQVKMVPVGPLLLHSVSTTLRSSSSHCESSSAQEKECLDWLEDKPKSSVLYIAFGTTAWLSTGEMRALALGLEASQARFVWVMRWDLVDGTAAADCLPEGFTKRTQGRGFFTTWAPQLKVLAHESIGAFLTHGGWNSTLEAIVMGVPMLTWPCSFDQKGNCELIVHKWRVGLPMRSASEEGGAARIDDERKVEDVVRRIMSVEGEGGQMKGRVDVLKSKARQAMAEHSGASYNNLLNIIQYVDAEYHTKLAS